MMMNKAYHLIIEQMNVDLEFSSNDLPQKTLVLFGNSNFES